MIATKLVYIVFKKVVNKIKIGESKPFNDIVV